MSSNGNLVFDGDGSLSSFNSNTFTFASIIFIENHSILLAFFMVEEGEKGRLRFHNNCHYLAFDGKRACILTLVRLTFSIDVKTKDSFSF